MLAPLAILLLAGNEIRNGGFETKASKDAPVPDWTVSVGATNGATEPLSLVKLDAKEKKGGRASLLLSGDDTTRAWRILDQDLPVRPGATYRLTCQAKAEKIRQETIQGTEIRQFGNSYVGLFVFDGNGELLVRDFRQPSLPTSSWQEIAIELAAPESARKVQAKIFLSMSGSLWVDDVQVEIEGGMELPKPEVLLREDFEKVAAKLPPGWEESIGARNGDGGPRSSVGVDAKEGAGGSKKSLRFSGGAGTILWYGLTRTFDAAPGDTFSLRCKAKARNVRKEGIQFPNLHARVVFLDAKGETVGTPKFGSPGDGTYDWNDVTIENTAPEGAVKALVGLFLSMSGDVWFDDLEVAKSTGGKPAYGDWLSVETKHLLLRFPQDHPRLKAMKELGEQLDARYEDIVKRLGVEYADRITVYLYRDNEQGKILAGRDLDFANPEGRAVHQRPNSTPSHEIVHCIALKMGHSQTGLFGEGIAVWLDGQPFEHHHKVATELLAKGELPAMKALLGAFRDQPQGYPAAGSFCGWLLDTHGILKFKRLYTQTEPDASSTSVLGKSWDEIDADWRAFLKSRG